MNKLKKWWLWKRRSTIFDTRLSFVERGFESSNKLRRLERLSIEEAEDAFEWNLYCSGGTQVNIKSMRERWTKYLQSNLLPDGQILERITEYDLK